MKKIIVLLLSLLFISGINCSNSGSSGGSDLEDQLSGNAFTLVGLDDVLDDVSASCSSGSGTSSTDTDASESTSPNLSASTESNGSTITFGSSTFTISGDDDMSGSWDAVDSNTVEVEIDGSIVKVDVEIDGNTLSVSNANDVDCGSSSSGSSDTDDSTAESVNEN